MKQTGNVVKKPFAVGSKSEHEAVVFETASGDFLLRIVGGNPFHDERLDALVGRTLELEGTVHNNLLILENVP